MPTLGEELKRRREERGITLSEIAESTRIGTRFLKAIEEGNFSTLPGGIFTRSFIRAYAKKVGLDEDEAITLYHDQIAEETAEAAPPSDAEGSPTPAPALPSRDPAMDNLGPRSGLSWPMMIVGAVVLLAIGAVAAYVIRRPGDQPAKEPATASNSADVKTRPGSQPSNTTSPVTPASVQGTGQPIDITLEATNGASWVKYQVDQGESGTMVLKPGESKTLPPAHDEIRLNLGNRTTLKLKIDNHDAQFPAGTPNFAAQVTISHDNLHDYIQK
ncbi:MAG TPA: helix-turn-helix domain-containing protein [Blastocatellia bacterium]|nr:helix-turn-helix domain-containing protein [Blastocatellia bacterium]